MQEIQYKELLNISSDFIWVLDLNLMFTYCSDNAYEYCGYSAEELLGTSPHEYMNDADVENLTNSLMDSSENKTNITNTEYKFICKNGRIISVSVNAIPIFNEDGEVIAFQGTSRDITQEKEADVFLKNLNETLKQKVKSELKLNKEKENQLIQQSRLAQMGEMISMIAHQWRQPLGAISATSINMQMEIELDSYDISTDDAKKVYQDHLHSELESINSYVQNLTNTIDDFRNFYKPNKEVIITKLEDICEKSLNIIKASIINENINIIREYNSNEEVKVYENEMMQVILNILQNSHDNFKDKDIKDPCIIIKTSEKTLKIIDNGGGVPEDIIEYLFDPYFSTKKNKNGTGLGLYMSKTIVEEHHNGILSVENTDDGICFNITVL